MKTYSFKINGKDYKVAIGEANGKMLSVNVNGADYEVELDQAPSAAAAQAQAGDTSAGAFARTGLRSNAEAEVSTAAAKPAAVPAGAGKTVKSPLPGIIISIDVKEGQTVKRGQKVAVIEAMKMENDILAESDGTVTAIHASKGDSVLEGADIVTIG